MPGLVSLNVAAFRSKIQDRVSARLEATGAAVAAEAKRLCPIDTGKLRDSIGYTYVQSTLTVQVHADVSYALMVEVGTSRTRAQPYLRPALKAAPRFWGRAINTELEFAGTPAQYAAGLQSKAQAGAGRAKIVTRRGR